MALIEVRTRQGRKRIDLPAGPLTIGRSDDNGLVLQDDRASRHHCVIEPMEGNEEGCFQLRDLGSRNGTKLNNEEIDMQPLDNGDVVPSGHRDPLHRPQADVHAQAIERAQLQLVDG